jgi:hypothetical protein
MWFVLGTPEMHNTGFWCENFLEKGNLQNGEVNGKITLIRVLEREAMRMGRRADRGVEADENV